MLDLIASMQADEDSGLITDDDVELLVTMLDEFKTPIVMERACMATLAITDAANLPTPPPPSC